LPDLVVTALDMTPAIVYAFQPVTLTVVVANVGNAPVEGPFWVDLYIDCDPALMPPAPNQTWAASGCEYGVAWLVDDYRMPGVLPLAPGATVTLDSNHYPTERKWTRWPGFFTWPGAHVLYAKADSYAGDLPHAAVLELDEENNVLGPTTYQVSATAAAPLWVFAPDPDLATRPRPGAAPRPWPILWSRR